MLSIEQVEDADGGGDDDSKADSDLESTGRACSHTSQESKGYREVDGSAAAGVLAGIDRDGRGIGGSDIPTNVEGTDGREETMAAKASTIRCRDQHRSRREEGHGRRPSHGSRQDKEQDGDDGSRDDDSSMGMPQKKLVIIIIVIMQCYSALRIFTSCSSFSANFLKSRSVVTFCMIPSNCSMMVGVASGISSGTPIWVSMAAILSV